MDSLPSWYAGRSVLVTGATGFMGKVLVEKLLRSCADISTIYLLIRSKRNKNAQERLKDFVNAPVFDRLRDDPDAERRFGKLFCVEGDLLRDDLNVAEEILVEMRASVSIVFHMAANVRFDQPLKQAAVTNTGGTLKVLELVETFGELKVFVHVSTSYCHCNETILKEEVYHSPHDPRKILDLVTWMDDDLLARITPGLLKNAPNTYAYTKCLTEQLLVEFSTKIPVAIVRPSIVTAAWKDPYPGWVDNLNGPTGLLVGAGKGVIRTMHCNPSYEADIVPVDLAINSLVIIAKETAEHPKKQPTIVHVTVGKDNPITWGDALEMGKKHFYDNPFSVCLWYPGGSIKSSYLHHLLAAFFFHLIPAYAIDLLLTLTCQKPFLVRTQKRIRNGLEVLQYYTTRPWQFRNERLKEMVAKLSGDDRETFYTDVREVNWNEYLLNYVLGARKYCVHEEPSTIPRAKKFLKRLYYLDLIKNLLLVALLVWLFFAYLINLFVQLK